MSNLGAMVDEIRGEIRRTNMDAAIKSSICSAVILHKDKRYKWNEGNISFNTVADQPTYDEDDDADIGLIASFDSVKVTSPETVLIKRDIKWMRARISDATGTPEDFAYYERQIYLYPVPSSVLTINILGVLELADLTQSAGSQIMTRENIQTLPNNYTTAWFTDGYEIIKAQAKSFLSINHLRNVTEGQTMGSLAAGLAGDETSKINRAGGSGFARPTRF